MARNFPPGQMRWNETWLREYPVFFNFSALQRDWKALLSTIALFSGED
jgi:hypothetical protein